MKKLILGGVGILFCFITASQQLPTTNFKFGSDHYLRKSKTQSTIAWVLLGTGVVCLVAPSFDKENSYQAEGSWFNFDEIDRTFKTISYAAGAVLVGASIPLFVSAHANKMKARDVEVFIRSDKSVSVRAGSMRKKRLAAIGIRVLL